VIDVFSKDLVNVIEVGLIEPLVVKEQVLKTCTEVASTIIRIDDVIDRRYAKRHRGEMP
jgi:chaperonin GroEL (HSP60 family)